jgi:hypothetical protein
MSKTAEEIAAEEREAAINRGDIIDENNPAGKFEGEDDDDEPELEPAAELEEEPEEELEEEPEEEEEEPKASEEEEEEEEEDPGEDPDKKAGITVPKARFDQAQRKARDKVEALEVRLAEMQAQQTRETVDADLTAKETELETLNTQYEDLLMEGELEKARVVRRDRDAAQNALFDYRLVTQSNQSSQVAVEQMRFDTQLAHFEASYPAINPDSEDFDEAIATEVSEVLSAFKANGYTATAALNKAMRYVMPEETEKEPTKEPSILRNQKRQAARKKVLKAVKKSPPDLKGTGKDSDKSGSADGLPDISKMSHEQFDALSEAELKKARGDTLSDKEAAML